MDLLPNYKVAQLILLLLVGTNFANFKNTELDDKTDFYIGGFVAIKFVSVVL